MKRLLLVVACLLLLAGPARADFTFNGLYLWGQDYNAWMTNDAGFPEWILGVSLGPNGTLVQSTGSQALPSPLGDGVYYLYAANQVQNNLGTQYGYIRIQLYQGNESYTAYFTKPTDPGKGPGSFALWAVGPYSPSKTLNFDGTPTVYFGWAQGQADKVENEKTNTGHGDDELDWYLVLGVNREPTNPVPLPGAVWLLGSGLLGLAGWRRFKKN